MKLVFLLAAHTGGQEWAITHTARPPLWGVLGYYGALMSGYFMVARDTPEFRPKTVARFAVHMLAAVALLGASFVPDAVARPLRIWFLDVGQGDSALAEFPSGRTVLIDAGNSRPDCGRLVVEPMLRSRGIRRLDAAVATHDDSDHAGGLVWVVDHGLTAQLVCPATGDAPRPAARPDMRDAPTSGGFAALRQDSADRAIPVTTIAAGQSVPLGPDEWIDVLNPPSAHDGAAGGSDNALSVGRARALA